MILTHPILFNTIVVLFIAFTSGWIVYVASSRKITRLRLTIAALENEKEEIHKQMMEVEEQLEKRVAFPLNNTPVIPLSSSARANKTS
jgi:hypothetical protein